LRQRNLDGSMAHQEKRGCQADNKPSGHLAKTTNAKKNQEAGHA